ncbi:DMT family transporter [Subtercola sp. PAMC28395]|uniref:EamA family transporter n=1 Tax=Subtercola sp. PAMC28395 TaxID=2846775 RepID=UPI001C0E5565|nr:DMT family transporter [Subtercola sp. PAMC28395]QWT24515.1 DMT family transporter [Subtercola sp. PAMC28395]
MKRPSMTVGLAIAVVAALTFGTSGAFIKPVLEAGWSPAAAVTVRALVGGIVLAPFAIVSLRGSWAALWRARWRVTLMALIGVAGTQLAYFAAIQRIPVGTAVLIEYLSPLLLVVVVWARSRKLPKAVVLIGSVLALVGIVLVVSPGGAVALDPIGIMLALAAMVGCAIYYVVAARPSDGLPPVALAAFGLLLGGLLLGIIGATGLVAFTATFGEVGFLGATAPWWVPLAFVGIVSTAIAYAAGITAGEILGSRIASFAGQLEVVAAAVFAWLLLGETLSIPQIIGGALIVAGIVFVRLEKSTAGELDAALEPFEPMGLPSRV